MTPDAFRSDRFKTLIAIGAVVMLWFAARSLVWGDLSRLQQISGASRHDQFTWIAPRLNLTDAQGAGSAATLISALRNRS